MIKRISKILPENNFKNKLRCIKNNLFSKNKFKTTLICEKFFFRFKDNSNDFKIGLDVGGGAIINELEDSINGYLKHWGISRGEVIIDCGAHIGVFSIYASKLVGENGKVIAIEPSKESYKILLRNIKLNNAKNIIPLNIGIWDSKTKKRFDNSLSASASFSEKSGEKINVDTLDNISGDLNLKKVDLIKMDIEGAEIEAIEGSKKILKKFNPKFSIASYHIIDKEKKEKSYKKVEEMLKKHHYKTKTEYPKHLTTYAYKN